MLESSKEKGLPVVYKFVIVLLALVEDAKSRARHFIVDSRAISGVVVAALLIMIVVVAVAVIAAFLGGLLSFQKTPSVQFGVSDSPATLGASSDAFIVRHLGGDSVRFDDMVLVVYNASGSRIYDSVVGTDTNIVKDQLSTTSGHSDSFYEAGEQLIAKATVLGASPAPGTYEIVIYYKPTMEVLTDQQVSIT